MKKKYTLLDDFYNNLDKCRFILADSNIINKKKSKKSSLSVKPDSKLVSHDRPAPRSALLLLWDFKTSFGNGFFYGKCAVVVKIGFRRLELHVRRAKV